MNILVTGATGYIGGRLIPRLIDRGHTVRVLVRDPARIDGRAWANDVEVFTADLLTDDDLTDACEGVDAAYYLVHSMSATRNFEAADRCAAERFASAASDIAHTIYLGGLVPKGDRVSAHLASRAQVGAILREAVPATEFRAGPIIGSGSASFEMARYLTERLPVMVAPRWVLNPVSTIAVRDVLTYLVAALDVGPSGIVEIGSDALTFRQMMLEYAKLRNLRRLIIPVPVLAPGLAARWVGFVTPIPNQLAVPLVRGVVSPLVSDTTRADKLFPDITPIPYRDAVARALERIEAGTIETLWSGAIGDAPTEQLTDREGLIREVRTVGVNASPQQVFNTFTSLGGKRGWLTWNWAWSFRGLIDRLVGGPGLRRGRRDDVGLLPGEAVDFWRVEVVESGKLLRLRAEMKVPGRAWLQWEVVQDNDNTRLVQTATFAPRGLGGVVYWYALYPIHRLIFTALCNAIAREAQRVS